MIIKYKSYFKLGSLLSAAALVTTAAEQRWDDTSAANTWDFTETNWESGTI
jgi:hypothetical protein